VDGSRVNARFAVKEFAMFERAKASCASRGQPRRAQVSQVNPQRRPDDARPVHGPAGPEGAAGADRAPGCPEGLRRVAVASVAALLVVLGFAAATAGSPPEARHGNARSLTTGDASATGLFKR
jgi:hypothetical protein